MVETKISIQDDFEVNDNKGVCYEWGFRKKAISCWEISKPIIIYITGDCNVDKSGSNRKLWLTCGNWSVRRPTKGSWCN